MLLAVLAAVACAGATSAPDSAAKCPNVKNAPFSADVITQYDRTLDNGGHIHRESRGKIFRDGQGRMRTESQLSGVQFGSEKSDHITINDPIQQIVIHLNPKTKTATVVRFGDVNPPATSKPPKSNGKSKVRPAGQTGTGSGPTDTVAASNAPNGQGTMSSPPPVQSPDETTSKMDTTTFTNTPSTTVSLGTRYIEGVSATGTRTTRTISAGTMGNEEPIVSISDNWFSTDLKVTVLTESDDGQSGHSTMKLVNIVRSEPNAALFRIPPDYIVKQNATAVSAVH